MVHSLEFPSISGEWPWALGPLIRADMGFLLSLQGRLILSNKTARTIAFFYTLLLHCLVFLVSGRGFRSKTRPRGAGLVFPGPVQRHLPACWVQPWVPGHLCGH